MTPRSLLKRIGRVVAAGVILPLVISYRARAIVLGRDRALEGSTQLLALVPGIVGQYLRRAFLARAIAHCHHTVTVEFGTIFSQAGARLDENVYIGPRCHLGLVHLERDVLLAAGVHVPSGARTHGVADLTVPIRQQAGLRIVVRIGAGTWVGSAAIVLADIGANSVIAAGAVVTKPVPAATIAAGVPARVVRERRSPNQAIEVAS